MEYAALDLETTGLDPDRDRVIEVGAVAFTMDRVIGSLEELVDPGRPVPRAVLLLTGIEPHQLASAALPEAALGRLADFLRGRQPVGHGAGLDVAFLASAGLWDGSSEVLDTLDLARILLPGAASHSLPVLAAELGLQQPRPHRAFDDADATRQLLIRLGAVAAALEDPLQDAIRALVAPHRWPLARFFQEVLQQGSQRGPQPSRQGAVPEPAPNGLAAGPAPIPPSTAPPAGDPHRARHHRREPFDDPAGLAALLGPQGPLAASLPDYEHRESQLQMLLAVAQIMRRGGRLVVEAGTGTGKSLAYLIPALGRALTRGEKVIVSTNTHTLQEQLTAKDLPDLREWLPFDFEACLLKGRPNYVSLRRWRRYRLEPCDSSEELRFKLKITIWLAGTLTGDRAELRLQGPEEALWTRIASDPLDCAGVRCTAGDCFVHRARERAEAADLVVVNHALLLADAVQGGSILPDYQHLVIDEAHHLEEAATRGLRQEVDGPGPAGLLDRLAGGGEGTGGLIAELAARPDLFSTDPGLAEAGRLAAGARARIGELFEAAAMWVRPQLGERDDALRLTPAVREREGWDRVRSLAEDSATALAALDARLRGAVAGGRDWFGGESPDQDLRELELIRGRLAGAAAVIHEAVSAPEPGSVYWFSLPGRTGSLVLRAAPLDVGALLAEHVFAPRSSVVFTSASLAVGGTFDYFRSRIGLETEVETLILESPFDYLRQALVCLPSGLPEPQSPEFDQALVEVIAGLAAGIGGRTLALFTSHRQLRDTYYALKQRRDVDGVLILAQGVDGPRRQVLKAFTETDRCLLLGTASFWEGIDLPGDQLTCVVMARLPFPVPSEPVFAARAEQVRDPFRNYALPQAALRLKQGFGRLIRRSTDRGAVVILDARISSRDYGRAFLDVLPPASRFEGPAGQMGGRIGEWLRSGDPAPRPPGPA